jgi:hypothetical protein
MVMTSIASVLLVWASGYQPRHRCKRETGSGIGRLARRRRQENCFPASASRPVRQSRADSFWTLSPPAEPEFLARIERDRLRRVLEGCALDDLTGIIPEIVQVIVHSSANPMTTAWNDFREASRNNPQEDAVVIELSRAHETLWLITNEPLDHAMGGP